MPRSIIIKGNKVSTIVMETVYEELRELLNKYPASSKVKLMFANGVEVKSVSEFFLSIGSDIIERMRSLDKINSHLEFRSCKVEYAINKDVYFVDGKPYDCIYSAAAKVYINEYASIAETLHNFSNGSEPSLECEININKVNYKFQFMR